MNVARRFFWRLWAAHRNFQDHQGTLSAASIAYYVAYMEWGGGHDQDGGGAMAFAFFIGPVVAIVTGVIAAVWAAVRIR